MTVYVPKYKHDIFVSYAHVDDECLFGADKGWVSTLVQNLKVLLDMKLGRKDAFDLWMDYRLAPFKPLSLEILDTVKQSATLVVILSPGYLKSPWCRWEREGFLQMSAPLIEDKKPVFIIEFGKVEIIDKPKELQELLGYSFWVVDGEGREPRTLGVPRPDPNDRFYYDKLNDLAGDLRNELERLKKLAVNPENQVNSEPDSRITIFLAEVTDDLLTQRDEVSRYLKQQGFRVLPETTSLYALYLNNLSALQNELDRELHQCKLFVQLLSASSGRPSPGQPHSFPRLQYERARELDKIIHQWRSLDLKLDTIEACDQRYLLESDTVSADTLERFKLAVVEQAELTDQWERSRVYLKADPVDYDLNVAIGKVIGENGIGYSLSPRTGKSAEIHKDFKEAVMHCDGIIIVYGKAGHIQVRHHLWKCDSYMHIRKKSQTLKALAVYEGPPEEKEPLDFHLIPNMKTINCRRESKPNKRKLWAFLKDVGRE